MFLQQCRGSSRLVPSQRLHTTGVRSKVYLDINIRRRETIKFSRVLPINQISIDRPFSFVFRRDGFSLSRIRNIIRIFKSPCYSSCVSPSDRVRLRVMYSSYPVSFCYFVVGVFEVYNLKSQRLLFW